MCLDKEVTPLLKFIKETQNGRNKKQNGIY